MMQFSRRAFLQMVGVGTASVLLAACQPKAAPTAAPASAEKAATKPPEVKATAADKKPVSIRFMWRLNKDENAFVDAAIAEFKKVRPDITVEPLYIDSGQFDVMYTAGDAPDALGTGPNAHAEQFVKKQILPLEEYVTATPGLAADLYPVGKNTFTWEGKLYCLPQVLYYGGTFINKTLFQEAGVPMPPVDWRSSGWTWTDVINTAKTLTKDKNGDGKIDQYGVNFGHWSPWAHTRYWGEELIPPEDYKSATMHKLRLDVPAVYDACVAGLQARADAMNVQKVMPTPAMSTSLNELGPMLKTGSVAMDIGGGWIVRGAMPEKFKFAAAVTPKGADGKGTRCAMVWADPFKIVKTSKYPDQAWDWIRWLAADPKGGVPIQTKMLGLTPAIMSAFPDFITTIQNRLDMSRTDLETFVKGGIETAVSDTPGHLLVGWEATTALEKAELDPCWKGERTAKEAVAAFDPLVKDQIRKTLQALNLT
jgi:multiple sugar transport system substrate-binding protein